MTAFTIISNALVAVGAKPFATTVQALRDNPIAAFEGDVSAVGAGVTLRDAALDTGAATVAGTTWVRLRTAGATAGAVGTYAMLSDQVNFASVQTRAPGETLAASSLVYAGANGALTGGSSPAGTWRCMGQAEYGPTGTIPLLSARRVTLWLRIS